MARPENGRHGVSGVPPYGGRSAELVRASEEIAIRLDRRGVRLSGRETSEQLVDLLDAVERFEVTVERAGADLLIDEPLPGVVFPLKPDDPAFVLPVRIEGESVPDFIGRVVDATLRRARAHRHRHPHEREGGR